jgi:hypothetical protein
MKKAALGRSITTQSQRGEGEAYLQKKCYYFILSFLMKGLENGERNYG